MKLERCKACGRLKKRSNAANARYWLLLHLISDKLKPQGREFSAETWHSYFKLRYLGADETTLPNGKVIQKPKSSADLDRDEFATFMQRAEEFAMSHGVYLDDEVAA